ncbi:MerR family transcriptional regulator [Actinoplanes sp. N902-109]|uniref:MerR family transcriptional regulator n=1 Tax=Actinoplanes sp. (strain N902-109) TaxID=649831 RepID=UPI0003295488|nr:helix-turn-helix domain-containing protein [Actinoplanes sp. N902-109]AGL18035.1 MerR family transcriptional regulator [Actinoplanes sp. N902-109]
MNLMTIGEFAAASGLSARALRLYDEAGLLKPAWVDAETGYRQYDPGQAERARLIASLRHLAMPLDRIRLIVDAVPGDAATELESYWQQRDLEHEGRRALARYLLDDLHGRPAARYEVHLRHVPARHLLCVRREVGQAEAVTLGRDLIVRRMREAAVPRLPGSAGHAFVIYHTLITEGGEGLVEWCRPVPEPEAPRAAAAFPDLTLREEPAHEEAYIHRPSAQDETETWPVLQSLAAWTVQHTRTPAEPPRMILVPERTPGATAPSCDFALPLQPSLTRPTAVAV